MISQVKVVFKYCFITSLFLLNLEAKSNSNYEKYGTAFFTSVSGDSINFESDTNTKKIHLHDSITIDSESLLSTGDKDYVFFKLSNNISLGLLENTEFKVLSFKQDSFQDKDIRFDREPSISYFNSQFNKGTIVVKSNVLSPLSVFEISLLDSKLAFHSATCVISYRYNILHIALYEGNISIKTNDSITYINAPSYYMNDAYNLKNSLENYDADLSEVPYRWNSFKDYISVENSRVIFFPDTASSPTAAKAKLINTEDFYNQSFVRPRSFEKPESKD